MSLTYRAAEAAFSARTCKSASLSALNTIIVICVGCPKPFGNSGRSERSTIREVRVSKSLGLVSRLKNPPGILPAAYVFSIY